MKKRKQNLNEKFNIGKVRIIPALVKGSAAVVGTKMIASKLGQQSGQNQITPPVMPSTTNKKYALIMKHIINRADIIGGLKSVKLAKLYPQNYQPGVGVSEDFELLYNYKK